MTDKRMIAVFHYDNGRYGSEPYKYEELKRGEWVDDEFVGQYRCSECDYYAIDEYDFCPNCGADMRKEGE